MDFDRIGEKKSSVISNPAAAIYIINQLCGVRNLTAFNVTALAVGVRLHQLQLGFSPRFIY